MSLTEIISNAISYPFSDIGKFIMVGILVLLAGLSSFIAPFGIQNNSILALIIVLIALIFAIVLSGYSVDVIKNGIDNSNEIPSIDFMKNFVNGLKTLVIGIVYFIIPIIIMLVLGMITGAIGAGLDHLAAAMGVTSIIAVIIFILFAIFEIVALARFADTGELGAALSIGEVVEDAKRVGILKIIGFLIVSFIIALVATFLSSLLAIIPFIGLIIAVIVLGAFVTLFIYRGFGLLYADA